MTATVEEILDAVTERAEASSNERIGQGDKLLAVAAAQATIWRDADGEAYASVLANGHLEHYPMRSRGFRQWLLAAYAADPTSHREINGRVVPGAVSKQALEDALTNLEAWARFEGAKTHPAELRSVLHQDRLYIDLGCPGWRAIEVSTEGRRLVDRSPVPILRSRKAHALPLPAERGDLTELWKLAPIAEAERPLLVLWLLAALYPQRTYPILGMSGPQGAGKSATTRLARRLTDPAGGDLLQPPRNDRDLVAAARNNKVLAFDNLSSISPETADDLCRLSTGAEIGGRALFTDHDAATFAAARPIIVNGIPDLATRGDLASRMVVPALVPFGAQIDEATYWRAFEAAAPAIMAALLDGLVMVLRHWSSTPTPQGHRMADFARLAAAAAPAFGWEPAEVVRLLRENALTQAQRIAEGDVVAMAVAAVLEECRSYKGTLGALYDAAKAKVDEDTRRSGDWPRAAHHFGGRLRRVIPALRAIGLQVSTRPLQGRTHVEIDRMEARPPSPPPATQATSDKVGQVGSGGLGSTDRLPGE
jgi:putative DNA primase/helicase